MKTIEKKLPVPSDFVIPEGIELQDALFFDIETTGLSRDYHKVYLIGSLCIQDGKFLFCQWLAEKETEETDHRRCGSRCYCGICSEQNAYSCSASHGVGPLCTASPACTLHLSLIHILI